MNITSYSNSPIVSILDNVIKNQNGKSYLLKELKKKSISMVVEWDITHSKHLF